MISRYQQKDSPWEGGSRVCGGIYAPFLKASQRISTQLFHVTDWLPTFVHLAGGSITDPKVTGVNQWPSICQNFEGPRNEILINIDLVEPGPYRSLIVEDWKLVQGTNFNGTLDGWLCDFINPSNEESHQSFQFYGQSVLDSTASKAIASVTCPTKLAELTPKKIERLRNQSTLSCNDIPRSPCNPLRGPCLFNLIDDPCENQDLSRQEPAVLQRLQSRLHYHESLCVAPRNKPDDPYSNPFYFNETWTYWYDVLNIRDNEEPNFDLWNL